MCIRDSSYTDLSYPTRKEIYHAWLYTFQRFLCSGSQRTQWLWSVSYTHLDVYKRQAFYWALQKSIHRTSIRDNHVIYKQIFGVDKEIWSRINTASINDINQFMKDNWRFGKGANRMNSPEGKLAGASAFYNAMRWKDIWNSCLLYTSRCV